MLMYPKNNNLMPYCGRDCCYVAHRKSNCKKQYRRMQKRIDNQQWRKSLYEME